MASISSPTFDSAIDLLFTISLGRLKLADNESYKVHVNALRIVDFPPPFVANITVGTLDAKAILLSFP
ncbi:uncharacterized protein METZ01_LOCUS292559 [marine metagenome]|uniref:Uncharacterized protein n=1 Tax=marine metagenome TaxID=408172 RepID=A0A382LVG2_9ZZZZ